MVWESLHSPGDGGEKVSQQPVFYVHGLCCFYLSHIVNYSLWTKVENKTNKYERYSIALTVATA